MRVDWDPEEAIGSFTQFDEAIVRAQSWYPIREGDIVSGFLCSRFHPGVAENIAPVGGPESDVIVEGIPP